MFTVSGTYHRVNWTSPTARKWMKRLTTDDLRLHRRQLHPIRTARAAGAQRLDAVLDRLGRRWPECC